MKKVNFLLLALLGFVLTGKSQGDEFKPGGKPFMKIFSNYHSTFSDGESTSAFALERFYLGYEYDFSENLSAKANFDIGDPGVGKHEMAAYVKNAYLQFEKGKFTVNFGLISTTQFKVQEKAWGYRYLEKSFQDAYKFNSSADLGVSVTYEFCDAFSADLIIANGEGYKKVEADSTLRTGFGVTVKPISNLTGRVYYDLSSKDETQASLATFIGYANDRVSLSGEYMTQANAGFSKDHDMTGLSFYATVKAANKLKFFGRFDDLSSKDDWNLSKDGQLILVGLEYAPVKGIKLAPNFRNWAPADDSKAASNSLFLNCEIKF